MNLSVDELWLDYLGVGGFGTPAMVAQWLSGRRQLPERDAKYLAVALNERFLAQGLEQPLGYGDTDES